MSIVMAEFKSNADACKSLPSHAKKLLEQVYSIIEINNFIIYGGAALDLLIDKNAVISDIDIAIPIESSDPGILCDRLSKKGGEIHSKGREYYINITEKVLIVDVSVMGLKLDIAFVGVPLSNKMSMLPTSPNIRSMDKFDINSIFWRNIEKDCIDVYSGLNSIKDKTIKPVQDLSNENPLLLLGMLVKLCAKYDLSLTNNENHIAIVSLLLKYAREWDNNTEFHAKVVSASFVSTIFKSICRATDSVRFTQELVDSGLLLDTVPEIHSILLNLDNDQRLEISRLEHKNDLIRYLNANVGKNNASKLASRLESLKARTWDG